MIDGSNKLSLNLNQFGSNINGVGDVKSVARITKRILLNKQTISDLSAQQSGKIGPLTEDCDATLFAPCDSVNICGYTLTNWGGAGIPHTYCRTCDTSDHPSLCPCDTQAYCITAHPFQGNWHPCA